MCCPTPRAQAASLCIDLGQIYVLCSAWPCEHQCLALLHSGRCRAHASTVSRPQCTRAQSSVTHPGLRVNNGLSARRNAVPSFSTASEKEELRAGKVAHDMRARNDAQQVPKVVLCWQAMIEGIAMNREGRLAKMRDLERPYDVRVPGLMDGEIG